jgi:hypothetical protein
MSMKSGTVADDTSSAHCRYRELWNTETGEIDLDAMPRVPGGVTWDSQHSESLQGDLRVISSNGLPNHPTGQFPAAHDTRAFQVDPLGVSFPIQAQSFVIPVPANPQIAAQPQCLDFGAGIVTTTGASLAISVDLEGSVAQSTHPLDDWPVGSTTWPASPASSGRCRSSGSAWC